MKRNAIIALCVITVLGALFMLLASNMFFYDILHASAGLGGLFVSLPAISVAMFFVLAIFYVLRTEKHPDCKRRITRLYSIILLVLATLGIVGDILAGVTFYHSFIGSHPFPGYLIIFLVLNLALIGCGAYGLLRAKKMPQDEGKVAKTFPYVMKTIGWFFFICIVLNRLGTFLGAPAYIYWRNFYQTFPFYLYLLLPVFLGVLETLHILGLINRRRLFVLGFVGIGINIVLFAYTAIMGMNDTTFISSLSQAMPLERMLSKPIELPIHFLAYLAVGIALLVQSKKAIKE